MGSTDFGSQIITFDYSTPGRSIVFNKINDSLLPTGIYSGGNLSKVNNSTVSVSNLVCFIQDITNSIGVRVETTEAVDIYVNSAIPYIILRYLYSASSNNYMDILAVAYDDIESDNLILGKCIYDGGTLQAFDYSRKTKSILSDLKLDNDFLKVIPTEPYSNKITVLDGKIVFSDGEITISEQDSGVISNTTLGRIDLIYIDNSGNLQIEEGVDAASPIMPSFGTKKVIAYITRGSSKSIITGDDITLITGIDARVEGTNPPSNIPPTSVYICAEDIAINKVVALDASGEAIIASKDDANKVEVAGISIEAKNNGEEITVQKLTTLSGFTGLTAGEAYFLGNNGTLILESSISDGEYRVYLGIAKSATALDISIEEATLYETRTDLLVDSRQSVLTGETQEENSVKQPAYLEENTFGSVRLKALSNPVEMAFATGFDSGPKDYLEKISSNQDPTNWQNLTNHGKEYLYVNRLGSGNLTYHKTRVPLQKGSTFNAKYHSLLHFEEATNPTDEYGHTWTASGAVRSSAQKKFGSYSYLFDGTDDYVQTTTLFSFSAPWTIEFNFYCTDTSAQYMMGASISGALESISLYYRPDLANDLIYYYFGTGAAWFISGVAGAITITNDTWHHICIEWDGSFYRSYIDGVLDLSVANSTAVCSTTPSNGFQIGNYESHTGNAFGGYIDEFRMTFGNVRYSKAFTPPASAFTPDALWFDTGKMKMQEGNPGSWTDKVYLPLGYAVCDRRFGSLLHFEDGTGTDWWTELIDDYGMKWTFNGGASVVNTDSKIGSQSVELDHPTSSSGIQTAEFSGFGTGSWTAECYWHTDDNAHTNQTIMSSDEGDYGMAVMYDPGTTDLNLYLSSNGTGWDIATGATNNYTWTPVNDQWYHFALTFDGSTYTVWLDGTAVITVSDSTVVVDTTRFSYGDAPWTTWETDGGVDECRISIGTARYTTTFTPSTSAFTADGCIKYIVMPPFRDLAYETGWLDTSDSTNRHLGYDRYDNVLDADEDVEHGLGRPLKDLRVKVLLSFTGDDGTSLEYVTLHLERLTDMERDWGIQLFQIDNETIRAQTGDNGFLIIQDSNGIMGGGYEAYNIIVRPES